MITFVMLSRLSPGMLREPKSLEDLEKAAMERVRAECPNVEWISNYAVMGPWDYLDIFRAPDIDIASKVSTLIRTFGHAHTEIWTAMEWRAFKDNIQELQVSEQ